MNRESEGGLLSPSDIAVLATVTRAAVSNWRRRHPDFPDPASGTLANPLFSRSEVEEWLERNGRPIDRGLPDMSAWSVMNRYRGRIPIDTVVAVLHALLCARKLFNSRSPRSDLKSAAGEGRVLEAMSRAADAAGGDANFLLGVPAGPTVDQELVESCASELWPVVDALDLTELAEVSDQIIERASTSEGRTGGEFVHVSPPVSNLLAHCASGIGGNVYDPTCGIGETLLAASKLLKAGTGLVGHDADRQAIRLAQQRFLLHDVEADFVEADVLSRDPDPAFRADAIVAQLPMVSSVPRDFSVGDRRWALAGPPSPKNPEAGWLQHIIAHLNPEGRGYVVTSPAITFAPSGVKLRRQLVHAGCVEAIVGLPPKMLSSSPVPAVLWVLCPPGASRFADSVLVIDASGLDPSAEFPIPDWLQEPSALDSSPVSWTKVPVTDLLVDEEVSLSPRGLTESKVDGQDIIDRYVKARTDFAAASRSLDLNGIGAGGQPVSPSHVATIRQLERQGAVSLRRGRAQSKLQDDTETTEGGDPWVVTVRQVREGLPLLPMERNHGAVDANLTQPGDILVTTMRTLHAVVDGSGGRAVQSGVFVLRVDATQLDPHYVAACVSAGWNQRFEAGFYIQQANVKDLEIPIVPLPDQARVVQRLEHVRAVADAAKLAASSATELGEVLLESVRFNVTVPVDLE